MSCLGLSLAWWGVASALLYMTWNRVIVVLFKYPKAKWWHSFLVLATLAVLLLPCRTGGKCHGGKCPLEHHGAAETAPATK